jgi:hypothetical protein
VLIPVLDILQSGSLGVSASGSSPWCGSPFEVAIQWGRYAELFDYTADNRELILTRDDTQASG